MNDLPWLWPGIALAVACAVAFGRPLSRLLGIRAPHASVLMLSVGAIASITLTPLRGLGESSDGAMRCDLSRVTLAPAGQLLSLNDVSLNILLFVPLGIAIGLLPGASRRATLMTLAVALPFTIEAMQLLTPALHRACEGGDIVDNLSGLVLGLIVAVLVRARSATVAHAAER